MKTTRRQNISQQGVTLIELLVVISIIAVLAGLLVPAIASGLRKGKVTKCKAQMSAIKQAIDVYYADYNRMPVSTGGDENDSAQQASIKAGAASAGDFVFGAIGSLPAPNNNVEGNKVMLGYNGPNVINGNSDYEANNSELMLILTGTEAWPDSSNTVNANHVKNPNKTDYLNAKSVNGAKSGGISNGDGVYRDAFGMPYIVTLDLNYDNFIAPAVYRNQAVSQESTSSTKGLNGLMYRAATFDPANRNEFALRGTVAIWSMGPDKKFSDSIRADASTSVGGAKVDNSDNVLTWQ